MVVLVAAHLWGVLDGISNAPWGVEHGQAARQFLAATALHYSARSGLEPLQRWRYEVVTAKATTAEQRKESGASSVTAANLLVPFHEVDSVIQGGKQAASDRGYAFFKAAVGDGELENPGYLKLPMMVMEHEILPGVYGIRVAKPVFDQEPRYVSAQDLQVGAVKPYVGRLELRFQSGPDWLSADLVKRLSSARMTAVWHITFWVFIMLALFADRRRSVAVWLVLATVVSLAGFVRGPVIEQFFLG